MPDYSPQPYIKTVVIVLGENQLAMRYVISFDSPFSLDSVVTCIQVKDENRLMKRKEQNRAAQRAFRERKEKHVKDVRSFPQLISTYRSLCIAGG